MSVKLIGWGRFVDAKGNKTTVPELTQGLSLWDFLTNEVASLAEVGFDGIQCPPFSKAQGGDGPGCDGYEVFDLRDLGDKNQQGSVTTRYGTLTSLRALAAVLHANGMQIWADVVLHQMGGGKAGTYAYVGPDGKTLNGRGGMSSGCFAMNAPTMLPPDPVPVPADNFPFGDMVKYVDPQPDAELLAVTPYAVEASNYTKWNASDAWMYIIDTVGIDGARIDDTKGTNVEWVAQFLNSSVVDELAVYSEYFDGNPANLNAWATEEPMSGRSGVEDFTLHWALQGACDSFSAWSLNGAGYAAWRPDLSYGFVDNPDTDTSPGQQVIFNKGLAYAYLLSIPINTVLIYGKDYYGEDVWAGAYGLKPIIDNLVWINKKFAYGNLTTRYVDNDVIVIERDGNGGHIGQSSGLLTCLNFNTGTGRTVTVATSFGANVRVHDYTGHHYDDLWTDGNGNLTVAIPQNVNSGGTSFCCFSKAGVNEGITKSTRYTLQTFFGAKDLPLGQATSAKMLVGLVNSEASPTLISQTNSRVIVSFTPVAVSLPTTLWGVWVQSATTDLEDFEVVIKYKGVNPWKN